jgi:hypothetical protein
MTITGQNINVYSGKNKILRVNIVDSVGSPLNIANCEFTYVVYKPTTGIKYIQKSLLSEITVVNEALGIIDINILPADTIELVGNFNHECEIVTADLKQDVIFTGYFVVTESKT